MPSEKMTSKYTPTTENELHYWRGRGKSRMHVTTVKPKPLNAAGWEQCEVFNLEELAARIASRGILRPLISRVAIT